ncbi:MAG TPA: N-formylglutamate amidohydrolase [Terriglobia bacterium]|nr:N-formylglutamate amidohydrolase [Terriglobia bacterium]
MTGPRVHRREGSSSFVFFCDHASNFVPAELGDLGLPKEALARHIAWDIGAAGVAEELSAIFDAPAILCGVSRLVIDANRQLHARDLIPETSDGTPIPGNLSLTGDARAARIDRWFTPYHDAIESVLLEREAKGIQSILVSIHSMTAQPAAPPGSLPRPWQISICSSQDRGLADILLAALRRSGDVVVGDNQPYDLDPGVDYSIPFHALRRNLPQAQVEFRQDEIADGLGQQRWARRFADALAHIPNL